MKKPRPTTVDFETAGIEGRPNYPPVPIGVTIKKWGKPARYYAFGHTHKNNCTWLDAKKALEEVWDGDLLFHNAKFDVDVAETHMGLPLPPWRRTHDTMFLVFLDNPHRRQIGLKPVAEELLGMPPEEQDAVADWLVRNQPVPGIKISSGKNAKHPAGAYMMYAPGDLVGDYANGDGVRTEKIFEKLWQSVVVDREMAAAYDRERELMFCLLDMERNGVRVDLERLDRDVTLYGGWITKIEDWIRKRLKAPDLDIDSKDLGPLLIERGLADPALMGVTATGMVAMNKAAIAAGVTDKQLAGVLRYLAALKTCLKTFMIPWLETAIESGGLIYTNWNQTRGDRGGTRTGRLSSTPNFQNIPKEFAQLFNGKGLPKCPWPDLPPLPLCRSYIVPLFKDHILVDRDYSQQEPRILAHFESGDLMESYIEDPWIDYHDNARDHLERVMGRPYERKPVKNINLGIIYGQGVGSLAEKNGSTVEETKEIRDAIYALYPGLKEMYQDMRFRADNNLPVRTWGGREFYCEPPAIVKNKIMKFDYKMVNYLIQGSAADCTKEGVIRFYRAKKPGWYLILQVHDQLTVSAPIKQYEPAMAVLKQTMESVEFDVQILSEGSISRTNWAELQDYDKKGKMVEPF